MAQEIDPKMVKVICKRKKRKTSDDGFIERGLDAIIKKYLDVHSIPEPRRNPYRLERGRAN